MLSKILIVSFMVWAVYASMREGMIFGKVQVWFSNLRVSIKKPLFDCVVCMAPWWGTAAYWLIWGNDWKESLICAIGAMGINSIITFLIPNIDDY